MAMMRIPTTHIDDPQTLHLVSMIKYGHSDIQLSEEDREELKQTIRRYREFIERDQRHYKLMLEAAKKLRKELNLTSRL